MKRRISISIILSVTAILGLFPRTASPQQSDWDDEMPIWIMSEAKSRVRRPGHTIVLHGQIRNRVSISFL
jgi:hypothetical protein